MSIKKPRKKRPEQKNPPLKESAKEAIPDSVNVAKLKNELSWYLSLIKEGQEITVLEHSTPIAKVVPYPGSTSIGQVRKPTKKLNLKKWIEQPSKNQGWDPVDILLEDRKKR